MWNWFRKFRRRKILAEPFPGEWETYIQKSLPYFKHLNAEEQKRLRSLIQIFIAEKDWVGCNGLELTDEIRRSLAPETGVRLSDHSTSTHKSSKKYGIPYFMR